jgi:hypothetical protein
VGELRRPRGGRSPQGFKAQPKPALERQGRKSGNSVVYSPDREHDYPLQIPRYERAIGLTPMQVRLLETPLTPEQIAALKAKQYRYWVNALVGSSPNQDIFPATIYYERISGPFAEPPTITTGVNLNTPPVYSVERWINGAFAIGESYGFAPIYDISAERIAWVPPTAEAYQFLYSAAKSDKGYWVCEVKALPKSGTYPDWLRDYLNSQSGDPVTVIQCNCPDFVRGDYRYLSPFSLEVGQRTWANTDAGCDRAQGCKHVYATRLYLFEQVTLPLTESYPTTPQP